MSKCKAVSIVKKIIKIFALTAVIVGFLFGAGFALTNAAVVVSTKGRIISKEKAAKLAASEAPTPDVTETVIDNEERDTEADDR